jgi:hypothetical protein
MKDDVMKQLVMLKDRYQTYEQFTQVDFKTLLAIDDIDELTLKTTISASSYLENLGGGKFRISSLPISCQVAPVNTFLVKDLDGDGNLDALLAGNDFYAETHFGRYDGLTGIYLKGDGSGKFKTILSKDSGFYLPNHTSQLDQIQDIHNNALFIAGQNNNEIKVFELNKHTTQ